MEELNHAMSLVTPPDQKSPNFRDGLEILKRYLQEKGVGRTSRNDLGSCEDTTPAGKRPP